MPVKWYAAIDETSSIFIVANRAGATSANDEIYLSVGENLCIYSLSQLWYVITWL